MTKPKPSSLPSIKISSYKNWEKFSNSDIGQKVTSKVQTSMISGDVASYDLSQDDFQAKLVENVTPQKTPRPSGPKR